MEGDLMRHLSMFKNIKKWLGLCCIFSNLAFFHSTQYALFKKKKDQSLLPTTNTPKAPKTEEITDPETGDQLKITYNPQSGIAKIVKNMTKQTTHVHFSNGTVR